MYFEQTLFKKLRGEKLLTYIQIVVKLLLNFEFYIGAYPYDSWKKWVSLTSKISSETVSRLEPISGEIHSVTELLPNNVEDHINEQDMSMRCQSSEEREANLVSI